MFFQENVCSHPEGHTRNIALSTLSEEMPQMVWVGDERLEKMCLVGESQCL